MWLLCTIPSFRQDSESAFGNENNVGFVRVASCVSQSRYWKSIVRMHSRSFLAFMHCWESSGTTQTFPGSLILRATREPPLPSSSPLHPLKRALEKFLPTHPTFGPVSCMLEVENEWNGLHDRGDTAGCLQMTPIWITNQGTLRQRRTSFLKGLKKESFTSMSTLEHGYSQSDVKCLSLTQSLASSDLLVNT